MRHNIAVHWILLIDTRKISPLMGPDDTLYVHRYPASAYE